MSEESDRINQDLRHLQNLIETLPPCRSRDALQASFNKFQIRLAEIPDRIMLQYDGGFVRGDAELQDVFRMEVLAAIDSWGHDDD